MCYHLSINKKQTELEKRFGAKFTKPNLFSAIFYANGFDAPKLPVITNDDPYKIQFLTWGLIPFWVKDEKAALEIRFKTLNSRSESIFDKASFSRPAREQRCLVLADGFFDWRQFQNKKYPYYICLKSKQPFAMAGIWDKWQNPVNKKIIKTFSIITTSANPLIAQIHNLKMRMPAILNKQEERIWLENIDQQTITALLDPYPADQMTAYPVSKLITARGIDRNIPQIIEQFDYKDLPAI